ncbi:hypothetical protein [Pseudidiomarina sp.]|uniref:hypothetical protein n=1 Tax=Pseudidiomarina sp. TaxID=2081707 RepID=UPI003A97E1A2
MKTIIALFTLAVAATSTSAFANSKAELELALSKSLHAQAHQVKLQVEQQTRREHHEKMLRMRHGADATTIVIADNRQVVKSQSSKAE